MPRPAIFLVPTTKAWSVLVAPVRLEILEAMRILAPCSIAQISEVLDRPADALYRHIGKLKQIGVVVEAGVRRSGRRFEQIFDLVADDVRPGFKDASVATANKAYYDTAHSVLKAALRAVRDSAAAGQLIGMGDKRNMIAKIEHSWITHDQFTQVRDLMMRIKAIMDGSKQRRAGRLYFAVIMAAPVVRKRGATASRSLPSVGVPVRAPKVATSKKVIKKIATVGAVSKSRAAQSQAARPRAKATRHGSLG